MCRIAGDILRLRLRRKRLLKLRIERHIGTAFSPEEKSRLIESAKTARSPHLYQALILALNTGMRDAGMKNLTWAQSNFEKRYLSVGCSSTDAGAGRTIPLNSVLQEALVEYAARFILRFGERCPEWYLFPYGKPCPDDLTRPVTTLKTTWRNLRDRAGLQERCTTTGIL